MTITQTFQQPVLKVGEVMNSYFQKSKAFMYPLLGFAYQDKFPVLETYLQIEGSTQIGDYRLMAVYTHQPSNQDFLDYITEIARHPDHEEIYITADNRYVVCVFSLRNYATDYTHFINGRYSKLSDFCRSKICDFYGFKSAQWPYLHSFLNPAENFDWYAHLLEVPVDDLKKVGELCSPYDAERETFRFA